MNLTTLIRSGSTLSSPQVLNSYDVMTWRPPSIRPCQLGKIYFGLRYNFVSPIQHALANREYVQSLGSISTATYSIAKFCRKPAANGSIEETLVTPVLEGY